MSEQKLTIKIGEIDGVHINQVYVPDATHRQIFDDFTSESTSSYNQDRHIWDLFEKGGTVLPLSFKGGRVADNWYDIGEYFSERFRYFDLHVIKNYLIIKWACKIG